MRGTQTAGDNGLTTWQELRSLILATPILSRKDLLAALTASTVSGMVKLVKIREARSSLFLEVTLVQLYALKVRPASNPAKLSPS